MRCVLTPAGNSYLLSVEGPPAALQEDYVHFHVTIAPTSSPVHSENAYVAVGRPSALPT